MVIQSNMSPEQIIEVWEITTEIFRKYGISHENQSLKKLVDGEELVSLLSELNSVVGSSTATCIKGG
jgi:hypothetical protein